jgi:carotenoid cleavage dioxygenase-like enzyme
MTHREFAPDGRAGGRSADSRDPAAASPAVGVRSLEREVDDVELAVEGSIPGWLRGTLLRNGPAQFDFDDQSVNHWFDGHGMLHRFEIDADGVRYANRFIRSDAHRAARRDGSLGYNEFATDPCRDLFERVFALFTGPELTDNATVNIGRHADRFVAMTETPMPVEFDPETLETLGHFEFDDDLPGRITTAHPHRDVERSVTVNYVTQFGRTSRYVVYELDDEDTSRDPVGRVEVDEPAYMHSFGMTERYVVLAEFPLVVNPLRLRFANRPFIENYEWKPDRNTRFTVLDRRTGDVVTRADAGAFFAFHHVNAFERDDELVVDVAAYPDATVIDELYLDEFRADGPRFAALAEGDLRRYRVPLDGGEATYRTLYDRTFDLPNVHYREYNAREYAYAYGVGIHDERSSDFLNRLVKVDVRAETATVWQQAGTYPGEPVFVPAPDATREDEGVVLSVVLDAERERSFLLVLDAESFTEVGRAEVPHAIPFGFHGQFAGRE